MECAPRVAVLAVPDAGVPRRAAGVIAGNFHQSIAATSEVIERCLMGSRVKPMPALPVSDDHGAYPFVIISRDHPRFVPEVSWPET